MRYFLQGQERRQKPPRAFLSFHGSQDLFVQHNENESLILVASLSRKKPGFHNTCILRETTFCLSLCPRNGSRHEEG